MSLSPNVLSERGSRNVSPSLEKPSPDPITEEAEDTYQFKKEKKSLGFGVPKRGASKLSASGALFVPGQDAMFG